MQHIRNASDFLMSNMFMQCARSDNLSPRMHVNMYIRCMHCMYSHKTPQLYHRRCKADFNLIFFKVGAHKPFSGPNDFGSDRVQQKSVIESAGSFRSPPDLAISFTKTLNRPNRIMMCAPGFVAALDNQHYYFSKSKFTLQPCLFRSLTMASIPHFLCCYAGFDLTAMWTAVWREVKIRKWYVECVISPSLTCSTVPNELLYDLYDDY